MTTEARNPGPTRYVLKDSRAKLYLDMASFPNVMFWCVGVDEALRFASATEASLYAIEHGIDDVEVVAV